MSEEGGGVVRVPPQPLDLSPSNEELSLIQKRTGIAKAIPINLILKWISEIPTFLVSRWWVDRLWDWKTLPHPFTS